MNAKKKGILTRIVTNAYVKNIVLALASVFVFVLLVSLLLNLFTRHGQQKEVPDLRGMELHDAQKTVDRESMIIEVSDSLYVPAYTGGMILDQNPESGTHVKSERRIFVTVNSYHQKKVQIPYVTGFSLRQAKNNLEVAGLEIEELIYKPDIATNNVLEQRYDDVVIGRNTKTEVEVGSGVTLVVGMAGNAAAPAVPKVIGFPLKEAKSRLWESGLNVGKVTFDAGISLLNQHQARVYYQSVAPNRHARLGARVDIKLSLDTGKIDAANEKL